MLSRIATRRKQFHWIHGNHSYQSGDAHKAHFGLGKQTAADLRVTLPSGKPVSFAGVNADQFLDPKPSNSQSACVRAEPKP